LTSCAFKHELPLGTAKSNHHIISCRSAPNVEDNLWYACLYQVEIGLGAHGQALEEDGFRQDQSIHGTTCRCVAHVSASHVQFCTTSQDSAVLGGTLQILPVVISPQLVV